MNAKKLTLSKKLRIGKYKQKYPEIPVTDIALKFKCTYDQARKAVEDFDSGVIGEAPSERNRKSAAKAIEQHTILQNNPGEIDSLFDSEIQYALAQLSTDRKMGVMQRTAILEKIMKMMMQNHLKGVDSEIIKAIIRRFEPQRSDFECLKIVAEEKEKWKNSRK